MSIKHSMSERLSRELIYITGNSSVTTEGFMNLFFISRKTMLRDMRIFMQMGLAKKSGGNYTSRYEVSDETKAFIGSLLK